MTAETFDRIHDSRPVLFRKIPDVAKEWKVEPFRARCRQVRSRSAVARQRAQQHAPHADRPGIIEPDESIGTRHSNIVSVGIIPVHYPLGRSRKRDDLFPPIFAIGQLPTCAPKMKIEMDQGQPQPGGEAPRQRRLARAGAADDHYALHRSQMRASFASRAALSRAKSSPAWCEERVSGDEETIKKPL